ncbi:MAG: hypothetical protein KGL12_14545 [Rhodospirillales bacterium]|nr:hypothetical protein [Rhodospirillales bacterium]
MAQSTQGRAARMHPSATRRRYSGMDRAISRRAALLMASSFTAACLPRRAAAATMPGVPQTGVLAFKVLRGASPIGTQRLTFTANGAALSVRVAADFVVRFGPIVFFRYRLRVAEEWEGGVLQRVRATADNDGKAEFMRAQRQGDALMVDGSASGRYRAPPGAITATHWNRAELAGPMIDPQNGKLLDFKIGPAMAGAIADAAGAMQKATRYDLTGPTRMSLYYDAASVWCGLDAVAKDDSLIHYRRMAE